MKKLLTFIALSLAFTASAHAGVKVPTYIEGAVTVMASEVMQMRSELTSLVIIDTRRPQDFQKGHIPGAVNVSTPRLSQEKLDEIIPMSTTNVIFYCQNAGCIRAAEGVKLALEGGFSNVHFYYGGYDDWVAQNYPVNLP
jgi:rhodanese-related sulfurtransferase